LDPINNELDNSNNFSVGCGVRIVNIKGRNIIQDLLISIGANEIGKVIKEKKCNIIDFNDESERMEVLNENRKTWRKNLDS
jgi:hypothetical protein